MTIPSAVTLLLMLPIAPAFSSRAQQPKVPPAVRAACNMAYSIASPTPGVSIRRSIGVFTDEALPQPVPGCRLLISGSFKRVGNGPDASIRLRNVFEARGWAEIGEYSADGKDGTMFAFRKDSVGCLVRGVWNGGADGAPEIPPEDWYKVSVLCTSPPPSRGRS